MHFKRNYQDTYCRFSWILWVVSKKTLPSEVSPLIPESLRDHQRAHIAAFHHGKIKRGKREGKEGERGRGGWKRGEWDIFRVWFRTFREAPGVLSLGVRKIGTRSMCVTRYRLQFVTRPTERHLGKLRAELAAVSKHTGHIIYHPLFFRPLSLSLSQLFFFCFTEKRTVVLILLSPHFKSHLQA